ncbi:MAG TPA: tRNA 2-thiouridine(34) synthase MnmA [Actinomycetota bacterium]|nr:tRNA 2-thiouridine(34) synthase MnmA [Actinomycetota bacterium]
MPSVLVAMSGGVDSSVAACLLHEQGFDVLGSHMRLVHLDGVDHGCCGPSARRDAAETARIAGIPFEICDLTDAFERTVLADFASEHEAGRTPNPCARCNGEIKFGAFLRRADQLGIDMVASGHYVRRSEGEARWRLLRGVDRSKDQSYMLHTLGQGALARSLFPVGEIPKTETRGLAERFGLPVANKADSQELCFAPSGDAGAYARANLPHLVREGEVVDPAGAVIGGHGGAFGFTIGQRRGTGVATGERRYVVDVEPHANRVVLGPVELLDRRGVVADRFSWIAGRAPHGGPFEAEVRIRYRGDDVACAVEPLGDDRVRIEFRSPQRAVAPGQSAVLYRGDEVLGGGRIVEALR